MLAALWAWTFWPESTPEPTLTIAPTAVRVARPLLATGADSLITLPFVNAIEAALTRSGMQVFSALPPGGVAQAMYVVEPSVQRSGNRARINVRLVDPDPSVPVWIHQQDFAVDSALVVQDSVSARVSEALTQAQSRRRN